MKNILVCVSGLTPQIITETLFCLSYERKIQIDEIYVLTTSKGRDVILGIEVNLGNDKFLKLPNLKSEIGRMCTKFKIKEPKFENNDSHIIVAKEQSIELKDVRDDKHNELFPNKVCEFLNKITSNREAVLYCSISGGRKSMGVDLAQGLSLFGRENDLLLHVLTHENNEFKGFFPETRKQIKDLELAVLPYVRLRSIIGKETKNKSFTKMKFTDIVKHTQAELSTAFTDKAEVDIRANGTNEIRIGDFDSVRLEPAMMKLFKFIVLRKFENDEYVSLQEILKHCDHKFNEDTFYQKVNKIRKKFEEKINEPEIAGRFIIQGPATFGASNYGIIADKSKFKLIA